MLGEFDDMVLSVLTGSFVHVGTGEFAVQDTLRGPLIEGSVSGLTTAGLADMFADARAGRSPHQVVHGKRWW